MDDLNDAVSAAIASATTEVTGEAPSAPAETTAEPETSVTPEPAAAEPPATSTTPAPPADEEFWNPTAEELALIDKSPELKKVYRSMQRGLTQKATTLAEQRREAEEFKKSVSERVKIADWIQAEPEKALRAIAAATGLTVSEVKQEMAAPPTPGDPLMEKWTKAVGPDAANILRPLIEETAQYLLEKSIGPVREQSEALAKVQAERAMGASIREFGTTITARGEEWDDEIQTEMAQLATTVEPGPKATVSTFLDTLYDTVARRRERSRTARSNLDRLRRVQSTQEPTTTARPAPTTPQRVTLDMSDKDAVALAVRQAQEEMGIR